MNLKEKLLSEKNIYKAILSVDSYLFNKELLRDLDLRLLNVLNDKFNYNILFRRNSNKIIYKDSYDRIIMDILENGGLILYIKHIINDIIDKENLLFSTEVFFKLKDGEKGKFRPLHTAKLLDSIAMVSMLQILIFNMKEDEEKYMKLSNLSKLIPSSFYGNIPSERPELLFEKWQLKYKEYSEITNKKFTKYEENGLYKYEIVLDLVNFFPSINPIFIFDFVIKSLEVKYSNEDLELIKILTYKLLYFKVENFSSIELKIIEKLYYEQELPKKIKEQEFITKGIPQGLPQSYFFGNLMMINISIIYNDIFDCESYFYVDDSVIYTNIELNDDKFKKCIDELNDRLANLSDKEMISSKEFIEPLLNNIVKNSYIDKSTQKIAVHTKDKSHYQYIPNSKIGYKYLSHLSRLASMGSFDINSTFNDHEDIQIKAKFEALIEAIDKELILCKEAIENNRILKDKNGKKQDYIECEYCYFVYNSYKEYEMKLRRFRRFFKYRVLIINLQQSKDSYDEIIQQLTKLTNDLFQEKIDNDLIEIKLSIISNYLKTSNYLLENKDKRYLNICEKIINIENDIIKRKIDDKATSEDIFYFKKVFDRNKIDLEKTDKYYSISKLISTRISDVRKHRDYQKIELTELFDILQKGNIVKYAFNNLKKEYRTVLKYWSEKSKFLQRIIYNTVISLILNVDLNDSLFITRKSKKLINYYELRLVVAVRNKIVDDMLLINILSEYLSEINNKKTNFRIIDYSLFEAIYYYKIFVRESNNIDSLILIHKYTTELWENGSKHMHFYTLHNQSHAIELIKNINVILKSVDYLKISKLDYFILFISCYLHDISMVLYPDYDKFYDNSWDEVNKLVEDMFLCISENDIIQNNAFQKIKISILHIYNKIDDLFEREVRINHGKNSAKFIRNTKELPFLNRSILDNIADVSHSHVFDARDVYHIKSKANSRNISLKFMMILIRLADLLDMNENRVSLPIFYNNKKNMSPTTRFHWISHLLTGDYRFINTYLIKDNNNQSYLRYNAIDENIVLEISVKFDQLTTVHKTNEKCLGVCMEEYKGNNEIVLKICNNKKKCNQNKCNFVCKWFNKKNEWLINELSYLQMYLNDTKSYFNTNFKIKLILQDSKILKPEDFDELSNYIDS